MLINIEDISMEEYEILIRGGNSPGLGRLSIEEMTMEEYDEMVQRMNSRIYRPSSTSGDRQGTPEFYADEEEFTDEDEDREWEELEMWLADKIDEDSMYIPFPEKKVHSEETINETSSPTTSLPETISNHFQESGKFVNEIFSDFSNAFVEFEQEIIEETWFDAPLFDEDEDIGSNTNQVERIIYSLQALDSTQEFKELKELLEDSEVNLLDETVGHAQEIINSKAIRRMLITGHTQYAPANTYTPYVNFTYGVYNFCLEKWILEISNSVENFFIRDVCERRFGYKRMLEVDLFHRETREWNDAWVKHRNDLVESNEAIFLDDYFEEF